MTDEEVPSRTQDATGVHDDLTMVKKGHSRSSGMAKIIMQGTVKKKKKKKKKWEDRRRDGKKHKIIR